MLVEPARYKPSSGRYQPDKVHSAVIEIGGPLPGSPEELSAAFAAAVPESMPYAGYFGALLAGERRNPNRD